MAATRWILYRKDGPGKSPHLQESVPKSIRKTFGLIPLAGSGRRPGVLRDITARKQAKKTIQEQLLRRCYAATLGRERRSIELKREVNALLPEIGQPPRHPNAMIKDS